MVTAKTKPVQEDTETTAHFMPKEGNAFYFRSTRWHYCHEAFREKR
jgi:hypothetical protein